MAEKTARHEAQPDGVGAEDKLEPEAQALQDAENQVTAQGYRGTVPDPTPNHHYTVAGVTDGKPTPETDPDLAAKAGSRKFTG
jgi:hypothetical protein